jgi:transposase
MPMQYPGEVRERAVRLVLEHRGGYKTEAAAVRSIAAKLDVGPESLRQWVRRAEVDAGVKPGVTSEEAAELKRANEILKAAASFFAAELDRPQTRS